MDSDEEEQKQKIAEQKKASDEMRSKYPRVKDFYAGKSILITGGAGFLGEMLLEALLRYCPDIERIYLILREKKGVGVEHRKKDLLSKQIFWKLTEDNPRVFEKVKAVKGDVAQPEVGLSESDLSAIIDEVSIVFHCASCTNFLKPMPFLIQQNIGGTLNIIELCKQLKTCEAFIYSSTAYSNSNRLIEIEEIVYRLPYPAVQFVDEVKAGNDAMLAEMMEQCQPYWPNNYCMSKCVTENLIIEHAKGFPVAIVRPSIFGTTIKTPFVGFIERNSGLSQICEGVGKGFLKVLYANPDSIMDIVAIDIVANVHILAAYHIVCNRHLSPFVVNCTSYGNTTTTVKDLVDESAGFLERHPYPEKMRESKSCKVTNNRFIVRLLSLLEHHIPAYGIDLLIALSGKRPKVVSMYRALDKAMNVTYYFTNFYWPYEQRNFNLLSQDLCEEDKQTFYTDVKPTDLLTMLNSLPNCKSIYDWSRDKLSKHERLKSAYRLYLFSRFMQVAAILFIFWMAMEAIFFFNGVRKTLPVTQIHKHLEL